jgi:alanine-synthesizing transaminase
LIFSKRFEWDAAVHPLASAFAHKRAGGNAVLDLADANPTRVGLDYPDQAILASLARPEVMGYEPAPRGLPVARAAVSDYYLQSGESVSADDILLTAGTSEAYGLLFKLLADPGDEILIPRPGYPLLTYLAGFDGLVCHSYPLHYQEEEGWRIDLDVLEALITKRTRAVIVVNPNNPTGNYIEEAELAAIDALCRRHELALIVDEVFSDFTANPAADGVRTTVKRTSVPTFVLNGLSKILGLPQLKLAWIVCGGDPSLAAAARNHLETLMDFYLTVATPVQVAAPQLLSQRAVIQGRINDRLTENARFLEAKVQGIGNLRHLMREGGWYAVLAIDDFISDDQRALELLERDNTLIHPGLFYDFQREGFVVLSLLPEPARFSAGIAHLVRRYGNPAEGVRHMD